MNAKETGNIIARLRKRAGYTQKTLSEALGVTDKAVSKWERGLGCPDISLLPKLSVILDSDIESLLAGLPNCNEKVWRGLLILNKSGSVDPGTYVYDKPLVYYLLSYFLLVGIRDILLIADAESSRVVRGLIGSGERHGIKLRYFSHYDGQNLHAALESSREFLEDCCGMIVYGNMLLYGENLTKQLQGIIGQDEEASELFTYAQKLLPMLFCGRNVWELLIEGKAADMAEAKAILGSKLDITVRRLCRGMVYLPMDTREDVLDAANFVKLMEATQSEYVAGLEEIVWRRGMVSRERFTELVNGIDDEKYRKYLLGIEIKGAS